MPLSDNLSLSPSHLAPPCHTRPSQAGSSRADQLEQKISKRDRIARRITAMGIERRDPQAKDGDGKEGFVGTTSDGEATGRPIDTRRAKSERHMLAAKPKGELV